MAGQFVTKVRRATLCAGLAMLALTAAGGYSGTVDFASGTPVSVNAVVQTMARVLNASVAIRHEGHTEEYIQFHSVDTTMRDRFGIVPGVTFEDGVRRLHDFLQTGRPEGLHYSL